MKAILYIAHGTWLKKELEEIKLFLQRIIEKNSVPIQEICFLKLAEPNIAEGFQRCVEKGATEITVVPLFLLPAGHIKIDIPNALEEVKRKYPTVKVTMKDSLGVQKEILDAVCGLIKNKGGKFSQHSSVLIVGVGGSDETIQPLYQEIVKGIKLRLETKQVTICYLAKAEPNLEQGLEQVLKDEESKIIVVPYLLFPGFLYNLVKKQVNKLQKLGKDILITDPLSTHSTMENIFVESTKIDLKSDEIAI
ncbi:sirohydrochlorin chelatase [Calidifontibacillus erzurumensis]|uniref:Sirohydrochlorin chelatase n=1 Tax=Calidifontibacillus erzurumensis TaxID=2741433 RepID=A0A8J8GE86_9BACI|nr:sirohydrochlorin chelatase [Calidifontibacillus erzurumensis]NSL52234.1 sirohydrochlorin chelatase [Calidifontibacillus erzurumensis]